jgi:hypothetical protein
VIADLPVGFTATTCGADDPTARNIGATAYLACENGPSDAWWQGHDFTVAGR